MIIKKIMVKRFRRIKELKKPLDFHPGLNIVKGSDNEAGKSSLRMAMIKALFQDPNTGRKEIKALTSWGTDEPWEVSLEFDADGNSYRITKSFKDKTGELSTLGFDGFVAHNKETIAEKIAELTGCPTEAFFESTACIGQEEFVRIVPQNAKNTKDNPVGTITQRLQARLSGMEGADIPALLTKLYDKTHHKDAGGPYSYLQNITERLAELRARRQEQGAKVDDILEKRRVFAKDKLELGKIDREFLTKQDLLAKNKKLIDLDKEIARDRSQYEGLQKAKQLKEELDNLHEKLKEFSCFENAEEEITKLEDTHSRMDTLSSQNIIIRGDRAKIENQKPSFLILVLGVIIVAGGLIGLLANQFLWTISVAGLFFAAYWLVTLRAWEKQRKEVIQKLNESEVEFDRNKEEEHKLLEKFGSSNFNEFRERLAEFQKNVAAKRDVVNGLEVLTAGQEWQNFVADRMDLDIQMSSRLKELRNLEPFKLDPFGLQELERAVSQMQKARYDLEQEIGALEKFFQYTNTDTDQLTNIEEELDRLEQQREFWEKKKKIYDLTHDIMEQAHRQTLSKANDMLEVEMDRSIALVTSGRYDQVKIKQEENDLAVMTFSRELNDWVSVNELSRATQDQFYICARLALAKLITEGKKPPILLDDPFVNFHTKRLRKMMDLLQELAKEGYQILLFTCSDAYDYLGEVISVDQEEVSQLHQV